MDSRRNTSFSVQTPASVDFAPATEDRLEWNLPGTLVWGQQTKHFQMTLKRIIDLVIASILLAFLAVPMTFVALAIKLDSPGPAFYPHTRVGHNGRPFRMFKFRSMVADADAIKEDMSDLNEMDGPLFKVKQDPRMTRAGRLLRRFSLDELPQLFNVLRGDMSLVGPRPFIEAEMENHTSWQRTRATAMPGMTGLWQVSGRSDVDFDEIVELDQRYVTEWSLWLDARILLRTLPAVLGGKGAY